MTSNQAYTLFETQSGTCAIAWSDEGVSGFRLPGDDPEQTERAMRRRFPGAEPAAPIAEIAAAIDRVRAYFAGERSDFSDLPLDLSAQTDLFRQIYLATRRLGWGSTTTYGALAGELELGPAGAWTIGQAMAKNPIPLIIPCHRVLAAGRKIGGFSAPGGSDSKLRMLELEGVELPDTSPAQQSFVF
ncbi:methylated-DNA-[protein]-cysteine S-methyltransferase [Rhizobium rosettiformans]|uniref:Methylated-DNA--[protein]-cysteine S-methyltransferase n=2 Tax=Rhizobium rosettiformans TaxID=1368430 RepID=A0A4V4HR82_9HYPH|nr:methylated-DNA--[protein]-cysteine S-methyltransferase [Rhizobium rosettiformans]MBB5276135.1 methylated-DNA-[protein]-cysteine S-methyltransferase [Rhizobium rosettiformans]THV36776.1 methylated-DNA--[protein]-cysteine S-methyltransferase [Rhizobium rosettiformans W3]